MQTCLNCNQPLVPKSSKKFCCKSCAAKFNNKTRKPRSEESRQRTSIAMQGKKNPAAENPDLHLKWCGIKFHNCNHCGKLMSNPKRNTCSKECRDSIRSQNGTLKRRLTYNGVIFQSSWEVAIAQFLDHHNITWEQPHKRIKWFDKTLQKHRTYLPDFYLPEYNYFLDVKNPIKQKQDADKLSQLTTILNLHVGDIDTIKQFVARLAGLEPA